ncbi:MAG: hypothetical protein WCJ76_00210 [Comamonadaceae bacterium]
MHKAPAVAYPVGRSVLHGWLLGLSSLTGALAGWFWRIQASPDAWFQWLYAVVLLLASLAACRIWWRSPSGNLRWDGQAWKLNVLDRGLCGLVTVHLDLQGYLLLCLRSEDGGRSWLWLERRADAINWHALRGAVFSARAGSVSGLERSQ